MTRERALVFGLAAYGVSTLVSMAVMSVGAALAAVCIVYACGGFAGYADRLRVALRRTEVRAYAWAAAALFAACAISLLGAAVFPIEYGGMRPTVHFFADLAKAWYLFWPIILLPGLAALGERGRAEVLRAWLVAFTVLSAMGAVQHFVGWPRPQPIPNVDGRFHATLFLGHHLSVASIFIFPFFVAMALLRSGDRGKEVAGLSRGFLAVAAVLGAVTLFDTYSRTLWVALPLGLFAWLAWSLPKRLAAGSLALLAVAAAWAFHLPMVRARIFTGIGIINRERLWEANWEFFKARPITGVGWHHNIEVSGFYLMSKLGTGHVFSGHAHDNVLDVLAGTGALGLLAWLGWCGVTVYLLFKLSRRKSGFLLGSALICAWGVFQLNGLTQVNFWEAKVLHQMTWMVAWSLAWLGLPERQQ